MKSFYLGLLTPALVYVGTLLKSKDTNTTGADDAFGDILIAAAPGVTAAMQGNERVLVRAMTTIRDTADSYLQRIGESR